MSTSHASYQATDRTTLYTQTAEVTPLCTCASQTGAKEITSATLARRWSELGLLLALWLLHGVGNFWWLKVDTRPPYSDMAGHAITTLRMASWPWRQWLMDGRILNEVLNVNPYPPFFYVTTFPFVWFVWPTVDAMLAVNVLYVGLLIFSTYGIGRLAVGGRAGLLAAFLVSMYPLVYGLSRHYLADVALMAVTAFAVFCLFWSRSFLRRWPSILLGVTIGLGVLTKWTLIVFLAGPLLIAVYLALRHASRVRLVNLVLAGVLSLLIGLPWFLRNLEPLQAFLQFNQNLAAPMEGEAPIWSLASWSYYLRELLAQQLLMPFTLLAAVGSVLTLRRCRINAYVWILLTWVAIGYVASSLFINKDTRYTMPYLPGLALLTAIGLVQIRQIWMQRVGLALILLYAGVQYVGLTVGLSSRVVGMPAYIGWTLGEVPVTLYTEAVHIASPARAENWQIDAILNAALADARARPQDFVVDGSINVLVVPSMASFEPQAFIYTRWRDRLPVEISLVTGILEIDSTSVVQGSDYIVTKSGDLGWAFVLQDAVDVTAQLLNPNSALRTEFEPLAEFPLPDQSVAWLFRRVPEE